MIVRDEERLLPACLASVQALADEIVVVDTGSIDATREIARSHGARVIDYAWQDDFAAARNVSLAAAQSDWILVIDADERLEAESAVRLQAFLAEEPEPRGVELRLVAADDQGRPRWAYHLVRLFPNLEQLRFVQPFHEYLSDSREPAPPWQFRPDIRLEHAGFRSDVSHAKAKHQRNRAQIDRQRLREPENLIWIFYGAHLSAQEGNHGAALAEFETMLKLAASQGLQDQAYLIRCVLEAMACCQKSRQSARGLELAETYAEICAYNPDFWFLRGTLWRQLQRQREAIACFETCLAFADPLAIRQPYSLLNLFEAPMLQLLQLRRIQMHHPESALAARRSAWLEFALLGLRCLRQSRHQTSLEARLLWLRQLLEAALMAPGLGLSPTPPPNAFALLALIRAQGQAIEPLTPDAAARLDRLLGLSESLKTRQAFGAFSACLAAWEQGDRQGAFAQVTRFARALPGWNSPESPGGPRDDEERSELENLLLGYCLLSQRAPVWAELRQAWLLQSDRLSQARQALSEALLLMPDSARLQELVGDANRLA